MLCDPCFCLFASFTAQRYKKKLTYTRISSRKTLRELIFHPEATQKIGKVRQNGCKFIGKVCLKIKSVRKVTGKVTCKVTDKMTDKVTDKVTERVTEGAHQKVHQKFTKSSPKNRRKVRRKVGR